MKKSRLSFLDRYLTALDLRGHGARRRTGLAGSRRGAVSESLQRRHNFDSNRRGPDPHDVSAFHACPLRGIARSLPQQACSGAFSAAELADRTGSDVRACHRVPARLSRVHGRPHHDRAGTLHRHGDRVERTGEGRHAVRSGTGRVQLTVSGVLLFRLFLGVHHRSARLVWIARGGGKHLHRRDRPKRVHLSWHSLHRRIPDAHRAGSRQGTRVVRPELSFRVSAR